MPTAEEQRAYRARRKAAGICWRCGGSRGPDGTEVYCADCGRSKRILAVPDPMPEPKTMAVCRECGAVIRDCPAGGQWCGGWVDLAGLHRGAGHAHKTAYGNRVLPLRGRS